MEESLKKLNKNAIEPNKENAMVLAEKAVGNTMLEPLYVKECQKNVDNMITMFQSWNEKTGGTIDYKNENAAINLCSHPLKHVSLDTICKYVKEDPKAQYYTEELRKKWNEYKSLCDKDKRKKELKKEIKRYKLLYYRYVTYSGMFGYRNLQELQKATGLIVIDFDDEETDLPNYESHEERKKDVFNLLTTEPCLTCVQAFESPTGRGHKAIYKVDYHKALNGYPGKYDTIAMIDYAHKKFFKAITKYFKQSYNLTVDKNGSDVARPCFLPHDPNCYTNPDWQSEEKNFDVDFWYNFGEEQKAATVFDEPMAPWGEDLSYKYAASSSYSIKEPTELTHLKVYKALDWLENSGYDPTYDYKDWYRVIWGLLEVFSFEETKQIFHRLSSLSCKYNYDETEKKLLQNETSSRGEVHIETFFWLCENKGGIDLSKLNRVVLEENKDKFSETCAVCASSSLHSSTKKSSNFTHNTLAINQLPPYTIKNATDNITEKLAQFAQHGLTTFSVTFSDKIPLENWPEWFRPIVTCEKEPGHKDKIILPSLIQIGAIVSSNVYGVYNRQAVYPNLSLVQYSPPAVARKGAVKDTYLLTEKIDIELEEKFKELHAQWDRENDDWIQKGKSRKERDSRGLRPTEPAEKKFDIAAKSTSAAIYKQLEANSGLGMIRATEGSVLKDALKNTYGDWLEILLYAFQNEGAKKSVLKDNTNIRIPVVKLALALTCPPETTEELIKKYISTGLISRMLFQQLTSDQIKPEDVFADDDIMLSDIFREIGDTVVYNLYKEMQRLGDRKIQFMLTPEQKKDFNETLRSEFYNNTELYGNTFAEFQFRIFLMFFKLAMTLSVMRAYQEAKNKECIFDDNTQALLCNQLDYDTAKIIILQMTRHTLHVYSTMHTQASTSLLMKQYELNAEQTKLYEAMPEYFTTKDVQKWCSTNNLNYNTVRRWLGDYVDHQLTRPADKQGTYYKNV